MEYFDVFTSVGVRTPAAAGWAPARTPLLTEVWRQVVKQRLGRPLWSGMMRSVNWMI